MTDYWLNQSNYQHAKSEQVKHITTYLTELMITSPNKVPLTLVEIMQYRLMVTLCNSAKEFIKALLDKLDE